MHKNNVLCNKHLPCDIFSAHRGTTAPPHHHSSLANLPPVGPVPSHPSFWCRFNDKGFVFLFFYVCVSVAKITYYVSSETLNSTYSFRSPYDKIFTHAGQY